VDSKRSFEDGRGEALGNTQRQLGTVSPTPTSLRSATPPSREGKKKVRAGSERRCRAPGATKWLLRNAKRSRPLRPSGPPPPPGEETDGVRHVTSQAVTYRFPSLREGNLRRRGRRGGSPRGATSVSLGVGGCGGDPSRPRFARPPFPKGREQKRRPASSVQRSAFSGGPGRRSAVGGWRWARAPTASRIRLRSASGS